MDGRYLLHTSTSTIYATAGGAYDDKQWAYSSSLEYMRAHSYHCFLLLIFSLQNCTMIEVDPFCGSQE